MQFERASEQVELKPNLTPMIDIVFQLLIFFMCAMQFRSLEGKLSAYLPKDVGVNRSIAGEQLDRVEVVIKVLEPGTKLEPLRDQPWVAGPYRYGPDRRLQYQVGSLVTERAGELAARLRELHAAQPDRAVTIDPRARPLPTTYADMVQVLDLAVLAGFTDISFRGYSPD